MKTAKNSKLSKAHLEKIWNQVPPDYYQKGVRKNLLQRIWHNKKLKMVANAISSVKKNPKNILDVGCASGWFLSKLSTQFPKSKCAGIDAYKNAIVYGKKQYSNLHLINADAHSIPFPDKSFDVVICCEVLEHVLDPETVLKEIARVLSKNGMAIIEMDTGNFLFALVWYWWTHIGKGAWKDSHIHLFNTKELERLILNNDFHVKSKKIFNFSMAVAFTIERQNNEKNRLK